MSDNIKRFLVKHSWNDSCEVTLEVDTNILTEERAEEINRFWSNADYRSSQMHGHYGAVIKLFGSCAINTMLAEGGSTFSYQNEAGPVWSEQLRAEEGWGGEVEGSVYGWCGIRVISADVETVDFDDLNMESI